MTHQRVLYLDDNRSQNNHIIHDSSPNNPQKLNNNVGNGFTNYSSGAESIDLRGKEKYYAD